MLSWELFLLRNRIGRVKFAVCMVLGNVLFFVSLYIGFMTFFGENSINDFGDIGIGLVIVAVGALVSLWIVIAAMVKRFHDVDTSGWWVAALFAVNFVVGLSEDSRLMSAAGLAILFVHGKLLLEKGSHGSNRFGPQPSLMAAC